MRRRRRRKRRLVFAARVSARQDREPSRFFPRSNKIQWIGFPFCVILAFSPVLHVRLFPRHPFQLPASPAGKTHTHYLRSSDVESSGSRFGRAASTKSKTPARGMASTSSGIAGVLQLLNAARQTAHHVLGSCMKQN